MSPWRPAVRGPLGLMIALAILAVCLATLDRPPRWTLPAEPSRATSLSGFRAAPRSPVRIVTDR